MEALNLNFHILTDETVSLICLQQMLAQHIKTEEKESMSFSAHILHTNVYAMLFIYIKLIENKNAR